jgi:SulP family sulfate permease
MPVPAPLLRLFALLTPFRTWRHLVNRGSLQRDFAAGLTNATLVLPQGVAFAAIAGLPAEYGFYTSIVSPIIAAMFGSSWHMISGPTTAISALVFAVLADKLQPGSAAFIQAAIALAFFAGVIQIALGLLRMGQVVNFVSHSVMLGFTAGAAGLIALSQIKHGLGIELPRPEEIQQFLVGLFEHAQDVNPWAAGIALGTLLLTAAIRHFKPHWPNYLIAIVVAGAVGFGLDVHSHGVAVIGNLPSVVPPFAVPMLDFGSLRGLSQGALAIAIVGLLQAVAIARAIAAKSGQMLDTNQEFVGQGLSNVVGSFFGAYPASGSLTRSGVNYDVRAVTPLAAVFSSGLLLLILLLVGPYLAYVPIPALAGVIILVAWRLIDFPDIQRIIRTSRAETAIGALTFFCTLFVSLEFAIYAGVFVSLILFLEKTSKPYVGIGAPDPSTHSRILRSVDVLDLPECPQVVLSRIDGPIYFGSVEHLRQRLREIEAERPGQTHMMLSVKGTGEVDYSGAELLNEEARRRRARGGQLHIVTRHPPLIATFRRHHVIETIGEERLYVSKADAIPAIVASLDPAICATCTTRIFDECPPRPPKPAPPEGTETKGPHAQPTR